MLKIEIQMQRGEWLLVSHTSSGKTAAKRERITDIPGSMATAASELNPLSVEIAARNPARECDLRCEHREAGDLHNSRAQRHRGEAMPEVDKQTDKQIHFFLNFRVRIQYSTREED